MLYTAIAGLGIASAPSAAFAAVVGYYEMCSGAGDADSATVITQAGHTPVNVSTPNATTLAGLDVFWVTNCDNDGYGAEYLANVAAINTAVQNGLILVVHDRYVSGASTILPGVIGVRDFEDDAAIDFPVNSPILTGPGGTLTNASLDGGNSSSHGYVATGTMPANSQTLAHQTSSSRAVTFRYPWGSGDVIYSTIPLDHYLGGGSAFATVYAANVVAYAAGLGFTTCAAEGYTGAKLTLCQKVCEVPPSATTNNLIILYRAIYKQSPPCL